MSMRSHGLRGALRWAGVAAATSDLARLTGGIGTRDAVGLLATRLLFGRIEDPLVLDYILNTFVNKIPFPEIRMELYRSAGMDVDPTSNIMMHAFVLQARSIHIGPNCIIGPFTTLDGRGTLTVGRNVNIAGEVLTIAGHHLVDSPTAEGLIGKIVIEDNAWIG